MNQDDSAHEDVTAAFDVKEDIHDSLLLTLIADAIVAAYVRRQLRGGLSPEQTATAAIPSLYSLIDYTLLALPESASLIIEAPSLKLALSTRSGRTEAVPHDAKTVLGVPFGDPPSIWFKIEGASERSTHAQDLLTELFEIVRKVASKRGPTLFPSMLSHFSDALCALLTHFSAQETRQRKLNLEAGDSETTGLGDILQNTALIIGAELSTQDLVDTTFMIRSSHHTLPKTNTGTTGAKLTRPDLSELERAQADAVFKSGFVRWSRMGSNHVLVSIPCHLGGVPWLVSSRVLNSGDRPQWWAYTAYRDHSLANDALRRAGCTAIASEMRRLLLASRHAGQSGESLVGIAETSWVLLPKLFPIPKPSLEVAAEDSGSTLPLQGQNYMPKLAHEPNDFFAGLALPPFNSDGEEWGVIGHHVLQREFTTPVRSELLIEQANINVALAENVYAIGHPLKHRLGRLIGAFETVENFAKRCAVPAAPEHTKLTGYADTFNAMLDATTNTARCLDLMAELARCHGNIWQMDSGKEFLVTTDYSLASAINKIRNEWDPTLSFKISNEATLARAVVKPTIRTVHGVYRLFNPFFDDLIFELVLNAENNALPEDRELKISVCNLASELSFEKPYWCLAFSNSAPPVDFESRLGIRPACWTKWRADAGGPKGGLRLLATQLRAARCGELWARPPSVASCGQFQIAAHLDGIVIASEGERV